jgi:hypothetical protein
MIFTFFAAFLVAASLVVLRVRAAAGPEDTSA